MNEIALAVKDRLLYFIAEKGLSVSAFEKASGLSNGYIRNIKGNFGGSKLEGILNAFPELSKEWLFYGKGPSPFESNLEGGQLENPVEEKPRLETEVMPQLSNTELLLRDMLAEERARNETLNEMIWELKEENGKLKALLTSERKGGFAANADFSSAVDAV